MTDLQPQQGCGALHTAANDNDGYMGGCDVAPPNPQAQRRGHKIVIALVILAGLEALAVGLSQGVEGVRAAFPTPAALLQAAAWGHFFDALGQVATVGLIAIALALLWRWAIRRRRS